MTYYIIPSFKGINSPAIELQNCKVEGGVLHADDICLGRGVEIDTYYISINGKVVANDVEILRARFFGKVENSLTWLNWSEYGICKV